MSIQISSSQSSAISGHISSGSYADGYRYAQSIVDSARGSESNPEKSRDLEVLSNWLGNAASINENDGSPKSEFVREATKSAGEQVGKPISDADFQDASDQLVVLSAFYKRYAYKMMKKHSGTRVLEKLLFSDVFDVNLIGQHEQELFDLSQRIMYNKVLVHKYIEKNGIEKYKEIMKEKLNVKE